QFGLGLLKDGTPALFKYRYHDLEGKEWAANYPLPRANVWGERIADIGAHPLARHLATATGASFSAAAGQRRSGYAVMGKIPFEEVKLVGGGDVKRTGITDTTGRPGEIVRIGVAFDGISSWGREQDFKVYWPTGVMFSDPTRSYPFVFRGEGRGE
ncbi:unnamed protein product, partial [marine sediment metagenome]